MRVPVKIKKTHPDAVIPKYATELSAGFDLYAVEDVIIRPGETKSIRLGLAFEMPEGYEIQIRPRSGISLKTKLRQSNSVGTIDADYRGEVKMMFDNIFQSSEVGRAYRYREALTISGDLQDIAGKAMVGTYIIRKGDRICQGILSKVPQAEFIEVDALGDTDRGEG